jgi:hypothetical protein
MTGAGDVSATIRNNSASAAAAPSVETAVTQTESIVVLFAWLFNNQINIYNLATGSAQKGVNKEKFLKIKIHIPKNKQLIQDLEPTFQQIEILQNEVKAAEELYKNLIQELSQEAIPSQTNIVTETNNEIVEGNEVIPQPKKKVVKKLDKKVYKKLKPILIVEENEEQTI